MYILVVKVAESDSIIFGSIVCDEMGTKTWFQIEPPLVINAMQCIGLHRYFGLMLKCQ